jgi:hypothetical protein
MVNVRPMAPFVALYPFDVDTVAEIAYYFDFDYADGRVDDTYAAEAAALANLWAADTQRGMLWVREQPGQAVIVDGRGELATSPRTAVLVGWKAAVYLACDRAQPFDELLQLREVAEAGIGSDELTTFLANCARHDLMVTHAGQWLSVAVHTPARKVDVPSARGRRLLTVKT